MAEGYLRNSVRVTYEDAFISLNYSFWTLNIPKRWIDNTAGLLKLLERDIPVHSITEKSPELQGLLTLLKLQGCFSYPDDRSSYTLKEVKQLFESVCSYWYAQYYSHPLWQRLRDGTLSRNGLLAWLIYNYHVARSVGTSASRCAIHVPHVDLKSTFLSNT